MTCVYFARNLALRVSQVKDFISAHSVVDSDGQKGAADNIEEDLQIKEALSGVQYAHLHLARGSESLQQPPCFLQKEILDLREANKAQMQDIAEIWEQGRLQKQELANSGAQAKSDSEMGGLGAQLAQR
jgi:hypothetical protein